MNFIDAHDKPRSSKSEKTIGLQLFEFDIDQEDYFLVRNIAWDKITTLMYTVTVDNRSFSIPSGTFILCGDENGSQDWIVIDELLDRPIDVFTMNSNFRSWSMSPLTVVNAEEDFCYLPMTKSPIPVMDDSGQRVLVISQQDLYHKLKDRDFDIFFIN